ncbi:MAG TPA: class I SAM-dependent methyltransferase [Solirubrobacterales bacterium]|nr:class I SAM-dependent methyltransferase [Solirubrobacterales bacterium]
MQQQIWAKGDFSVVANIVYFSSEALAESLQIVPGERVLDVACGSGNGSLAAARRAWGNTVGCDFVPALLERARERAAAERLEIEFVEADAQELPFGDGEFDVVMSVFGAMFAEDHAKTAAELLRVAKPGGRIGMANWCPDGGLKGLFGAIVKHTGAPPLGTTPPVLWGAEDHVRELFGNEVSDLKLERRRSRQTFFSPDHYIEFFRTYFGPIQTAFEKVGPEGEEALAADLRAWLEAENVAGERACVIEPEYLELIATKR